MDIGIEGIGYRVYGYRDISIYGYGYIGIEEYREIWIWECRDMGIRDFVFCITINHRITRLSMPARIGANIQSNSPLSHLA